MTDTTDTVITDTTDSDNEIHKISAFIPTKEYREFKSLLAYKGWTFSEYLLKVIRHPEYKKFIAEHKVPLL